MPFEQFSRRAARTEADTKWLSVQGNGSISVSYSALSAVGLPDAVHLFFDPETHRIALKPAPADSKDAYRTRPQGRGDNPHGARVISSSAFFKYIGMNAKQAAGRFDATIEDDMIIAQMPVSAFA